MNQVISTKTITNNGHNAAHHLNWSINTRGKIIKAVNPSTGVGKMITWTSNRVREMIAGEKTFFNSHDNVFSIRGTASGTHANGNSFTATITSPLITGTLGTSAGTPSQRC